MAIDQPVAGSKAATLESLGCGRILPGASGSRLEAHEPMALQQFVNTAERDGLAELTIQDPLDLRSTK